MAIILQPQTNTIGDVLGRGLGQGLQQLVGGKLEQLKTQQALSTLGISPQQAQGISNLPPQLRDVVAKQIMQQQNNLGFARNLAGLTGQPSVSGQEGQPSNLQTVSNMLPGQNQAGMDINQLAKFKPEQQLKIAEMNRQSNLQNTKIALNETKTYRDELDKAASNTREDYEGLKAQKSLVESGKLMGPKSAFLLDLVGNYLNFDENMKTAFKNGETQVFEKLNVPYFRSLKDSYGSRPTQWDAQQFQKGFASIYQTKAGKEVILENMMNKAEIKIQEQKIKDAIIRRNGGIPPLDLRSQVDEQLQPFRDQQYKKLQKTTSDILTKQYAPKQIADKGTMVTSDDNGVTFISNGKNWEVMYSDNQGE